MRQIADVNVDLGVERNAEVNAKINEFAIAMCGRGQSASYYNEKRNCSKDKAEADIFLGKKAEFLAAEFLASAHFFPLLEPDLSIRKGKAKGWGPDLEYADYSFHIKACSAYTLQYCKDYSWTFQYANNDGSMGLDHIFKDGEGWIILMYVGSARAQQGVVKAVVSWQELQPLLRDPVKESLKGLKKCLYYSDLPE